MVLQLGECPSCFEVVAVFCTGKMRQNLPGLVRMLEFDGLIVWLFFLMGNFLLGSLSNVQLTCLLLL